MSDEQWDNEVSPDIDYIPVCTDLPEVDDAVSLGTAPPDNAR